jgi:Phosphodiester glycosidase
VTREFGSALALLLALASCRERDGVPAPLASGAPAPSTSAPSRGPRRDVELVSEQRHAGIVVRSGTLGAEARWGFSDVAVELAQVRLDIVRAERGSELARLLPPAALAIVNGGYFEADFRPSGWLKRGGVELMTKADTGKGGVLALGPGGERYIGPFSGLTFEPELAIQSFPLIVEVDGSAGIRRDDGRRAARTVVCWVDGRMHFVVIAAPRGDGPTLFESVELLRRPWPDGFGCKAALNLDGGPSSGVWFSPELGARQRPPSAPVAYGIALFPR